MILITQNAKEELIKLLATQSSGTYVRIKVVGGGCSGLNYKLEFDANEIADSDKTLVQDGLLVAVDGKSSIFLSGTELDFSGGLEGKGFTFNNPNAKRTCGCGSSFSV